MTEKKETILQVLKGKVSFKNESGSTIVKKKRQVEATNYTSPTSKKIKDIKSITKWVSPIKPKKCVGGWIMKRLVLTILVIGVLAVGYFLYQRKSSPPTETQTKVGVPIEFFSPEDPQVSEAVKVGMSGLKALAKSDVNTLRKLGWWSWLEQDLKVHRMTERDLFKIIKDELDPGSRKIEAVYKRGAEFLLITDPNTNSPIPQLKQKSIRTGIFLTKDQEGWKVIKNMPISLNYKHNLQKVENWKKLSEHVL